MNLTSIRLDSIDNFTKPFPEPFVHLRFLLYLIKSLSISSVLLLNISTVLLYTLYTNYLDLWPGVRLEDSIPAIAQISS